MESEADTVSIDKPKKFQYKDWIEFEESMVMYLDSITNLKDIPMSYVIRKDLTADRSDLTRMERKDQIIYNTPLQEYLFTKDNETVGKVIRECYLATEAEPWIKNMKRGREAMTALRTHYDGPDEAKKRLSAAKAQLDKLFYRNEATFSFEKYATTLNEVYNINERYDEPIYESDKVRNLSEKCQNNHVEFKQTVVLCRTQHKIFAGAVTMLKEAVGRLFPDIGQARGKRTIAEVN